MLQEFDQDDYRNARFLTTPRQTNTRWAMNLVKEVPPKAVEGRIVACDGGPGALGHPRVYINLVSSILKFFFFIKEYIFCLVLNA